MTTETIIKAAGAVGRWLKVKYAGQNGFVAAVTMSMVICIGVGLIVANLPFVVQALSGGARVKIVEARIDHMESAIAVDRKDAIAGREEIISTLVDIKATLVTEVKNNEEWRQDLSRQLSELRAMRFSGTPYIHADNVVSN